MRDVMVDLETLGNSAGCAILSLGAVAFEPETGALGREFYSVVNVASCVVAGLRFDADTLEWWGRQSAAAREVMAQAYEAQSPALENVLLGFDAFLKVACGRVSPRIWGNGADFDNAILVSCYKALRLPPPWEFWDGRCYRTLKNLHREVRLERTGTHHNALDDARTQANHALAIFDRMRPSPPNSEPGETA